MPSNLNLYDQLTGKRHGDINLPSQGKIDPRLSDPAEKVKSLANNSALQALKNYGLSAAEQAKKSK